MQEQDCPYYMSYPPSTHKTRQPPPTTTTKRHPPPLVFSSSVGINSLSDLSRTIIFNRCFSDHRKPARMTLRCSNIFKEVELVWGKGLVQKRETERRQMELILEKDKPFARTRDDPELNMILKNKVRFGDPMSYLVKRKSSELVLPDLGEDKGVKESGFGIPQEIPTRSWLRRKLNAPPNRYGIKPGRHWDGVDRSNGYEANAFKGELIS